MTFCRIDLQLCLPDPTDLRHCRAANGLAKGKDRPGLDRPKTGRPELAPVLQALVLQAGPIGLGIDHRGPVRQVGDHQGIVRPVGDRPGIARHAPGTCPFMDPATGADILAIDGVGPGPPIGGPGRRPVRLADGLLERGMTSRSTTTTERRITTRETMSTTKTR